MSNKSWSRQVAEFFLARELKFLKSSIEKWHHKQNLKTVIHAAVHFVTCHKQCASQIALSALSVLSRCASCNCLTLVDQPCERPWQFPVKSCCGWSLSPVPSFMMSTITGICLHCRSCQGAVRVVHMLSAYIVGTSTPLSLAIACI